jgi:hypothetical protein
MTSGKTLNLYERLIMASVKNQIKKPLGLLKYFNNKSALD